MIISNLLTGAQMAKTDIKIQICKSPAITQPKSSTMPKAHACFASVNVETVNHLLSRNYWSTFVLRTKWDSEIQSSQARMQSWIDHCQCTLCYLPVFIKTFKAAHITEHVFSIFLKIQQPWLHGYSSDCWVYPVVNSQHLKCLYIFWCLAIFIAIVQQSINTNNFQAWDTLLLAGTHYWETVFFVGVLFILFLPFILFTFYSEISWKLNNETNAVMCWIPHLECQFLASSVFSETSCSRLVHLFKECSLVLSTAILCHVPRRIGHIIHQFSFTDNHSHDSHFLPSFSSSIQLGTAK